MKLKITSLVLNLLVVLLLAGCSQQQEQTPPTHQQSSEQSDWYREVETSHGKLILTAQPKRIVSTSVTITGTLLAIDAPVIGTGGAHPNTEVSDENGFFRQWADVAKQRKVKSLYQGQVDVEAVASLVPDLIIVSATSGDSALHLHEQLSAIAPVMVVNYDDKSWIELAQFLGAALGREKQAEFISRQFEQRITRVKSMISLPPQPSTAMVYISSDIGANVWTEYSAHGKLLNALGFKLASVPHGIAANKLDDSRKDIIQLNADENFASAITGASILLFSADEKKVKQIKSDKFLALLPAISKAQVYALGLDSFRLDYYSANNLLDLMKTKFSG